MIKISLCYHNHQLLWCWVHRSIMLWHHQYDLSYSFRHVRPPSKQYLTIGTPRTSTDQKSDHRFKCLTECTLNVSFMKVLSIFCQWKSQAWLWSSYLLIPTPSSHEVKPSNIHAQATSYLILVATVWEFEFLESRREELKNFFWESAWMNIKYYTESFERS